MKRSRSLSLGKSKKTKKKVNENPRILVVWSKRGKTHPWSAIERYLSTMTPAKVVLHGRRFPSIEHAFQAEKFLYTKTGGHPALVERFTAGTEPFGTLDPLKVKGKGGKGQFAKDKVTLDGDRWNRDSVSVMRKLVASRKKHDPLFRSILAKGKREGVHISHYEKPRGAKGKVPFWGAYTPSDSRHPVGHDHYGKLLME